LPWADTEVRPYEEICFEKNIIFNTLKAVWLRSYIAARKTKLSGIGNKE
jgi:hypothetical protein